MLGGENLISQSLVEQLKADILNSNQQAISSGYGRAARAVIKLLQEAEGNELYASAVVSGLYKEKLVPFGDSGPFERRSFVEIVLDHLEAAGFIIQEDSQPIRLIPESLQTVR